MEKKIINRVKKKVICKQLSTATAITCGTDNPAGLGCVFYELEGGEVATQFVAGKWHEGHDGIMHGGLSGAVLDEVMGRSNRAYDKMSGGVNTFVVTGEMTVKYYQPICVGQLMTAYGRVERCEGRKRFASSEILNEEGVVMASATGFYISVKEDETNYDDMRGKSDSDPEEL